VIFSSYRKDVTAIFLFSEAFFAQRLQGDGVEIKFSDIDILYRNWKFE
jgi:hypothetical protein